MHVQNLGLVLSFFGLLLDLSASAWAQTESRTIRHVDPRQAPLLGQGYQAETDELRQPCVTGEPAFDNKQFGSIELGTAMSRDEITEDISAMFSGGINVFIASAKVSNKLSSLVNEDAYKRRLVYKASFRTKTEVLARPRPNALGEQLIGLADSNLSVANCGREFVSSIEHGGDLYIAVEFDFASKEILNDISTRVEFSVLGIKKVKEFSKQIRKFKSSIHVNVDAFQLGGQPDKLQKVLNQYPSRNCTVDAMERCDELIQKLIDYATAEDQFPSQIQTQSPISFTTSSYKSSGLSKLVATASPMMKAEQEFAYQEMIGWYNRESVKLQKIAELLASPLISTKQRNTLYFARDTVDQNVTIALKALASCEATPGACPGERDRLGPRIVLVDESLLTAWRDFFYYCMRNSADQSLGITAVLRNLNVSDCEAANDQVTRLKTLDLRGLGLSNVDFLTALPKIENLDISRNRISHLYALSRLGQLKTLQANRNEIDSLGGLEGLKSLQKLTVARNQISSLDSIANLSSLRFLSCYDNLHH